MERSEPALVPQWLRCSGNVTAAASTTHHFASSSSVVDVHLSPLSVRNKAFSSNGSSKHPYSSFTQSHRDKNRDRVKERTGFRDLSDSDPLTSILGPRVENAWRRSQSLVSRPGEALPRRATEHKDGGGAKRSLSGGSAMRGVQKVPFEKDFPSLGVEVKHAASDVGRLSSPSFGTAVQSLSIGNSGLIGGEGWTSALVKVPAIIGNNISANTSSRQNAYVSPASGVLSSIGGLNMAETLSKAPSHVHIIPQLPDKIQRLEELAIKQSRQLIPMRPSTPKPLIVNFSDNLKQQSKITVKANETIVAAKIGQQQQAYQSQSAAQSLRAGQIKSDASKTSHGGKFFVLKPVWENGVASTAKDCSSVTGVENNQVPVATVAPTTPLSSINHPHHATTVRKTAALNPKSIAEKRASLAQTQSRNDFFNLMRKKNSLNSSVIALDSGPALKDSGVIEEVGNTLESPCVLLRLVTT